MQGGQVADGTPLPALPAHPAGITTIAVTPQGDGIIAGFGNGRISVTAPAGTAAPLEQVVAGDGRMTGLRFSPDGRYLESTKKSGGLHQDGRDPRFPGTIRLLTARSYPPCVYL